MAHEAPWRVNSRPSSPHGTPGAVGGNSHGYASTVRSYIGKVANQVVETLTPRRSPSQRSPIASNRSPTASQRSPNASQRSPTASQRAAAAAGTAAVSADAAALTNFIAARSHRSAASSQRSATPPAPAQSEPDWKPLIS